MFSPTDKNIAELTKRAMQGDRVVAIADALSCCPKTVYNWIDRLDIDYEPRRHGNATPRQIEEDVVRRYVAGAFPTEIANLHDLTARGVHGILDRRGVPKRHDRRKYHCNDCFFDVLTERSAYWIGFFAADAYINTDRGYVGIALARVDRSQLEALLDDIDGEHPIEDFERRGHQYSRVTVYSKQWLEALARHGIFTKRGAPLGWPENLSENLLPHFLRGVVDGDGCWTRSGEQRAFSLVGAWEFVERFAAVLRKRLGLSKVHIPNAGKSKKAWQLRYTGNRNCYRIAELLYPRQGDSVTLRRKFETISPLLQNGPPSGRLRPRKLSPQQEVEVGTLWSVHKITQTELAKRYDVSRGTIHNTLDRLGLLLQGESRST